jgi:DNA segregation ATPase FtsK/SpoIIIE-like protein
VWLSKHTGSRGRADLIGLRIAGERLVIEPIEVKAHQADAVHIQGQQLVGQAVNQIKESIAILRTVFIPEEAQLLFTPARREVLQYQLYRECFREQHKQRGESWPKGWTARLKSTFTQPQPKLELSIEGIIVQVQLEQSYPLETQQFPDQRLTLITLGSNVIQPLVGYGQATPTPNLENIERTPTQYVESVKGKTEDTLDKSVAYFDGPLPETSVLIDTPETFKELDTQQSWIAEKANKLEKALRHFNVAVRQIDSKLTEIGPSVVRYKVRLYPGEKIQKVQNIAEDLQRELAITAVPLIENISGTHFVGIDLPRPNPEIVSLKPLLTELNTAKGDLPIILGLKPDGKLIIQDIAEMPHMLVAGETGSGKTMFLYTLIVSLLNRYPGNQLRLLLIDPKQTDFVFFDDIPNLIGNKVFIEPETAIEQLQHLLDEEIPRRRELFRERQIIKIQEYNRLNPAKTIPFIVVVIDEYADLVQVLARNERQTFERQIARMAQIARSFGIHLVVATQRPSADIVTSRIKANLTTRIAFRLPSHHDSMTILDQSGAQNLLGRGDMLIRQNELIRIQAPLIYRNDLLEFLDNIRNY